MTLEGALEALRTLGLKVMAEGDTAGLMPKRSSDPAEPLAPELKDWSKTKMAPLGEEQAAVPKAPHPLLPEKGGGDVPKVCQMSAS